MKVLSKRLDKIFAGLVLVLVLVVGCVVGFSGCRGPSEELTIAALKKKGELVVLTEPNFRPYEYYDDSMTKIIGVDLEIAGLIAERLGVSLRVVPWEFDGLFTALNSHKGDVIMAARSLTGENQGYFPHSKPYADACQKILLPKDCDDIKEFRDLAGKKVGVPLGTTSENCVREAVDFGSLKDTKTKVLSYVTNSMVVHNLRNKYVDAALLDFRAAENYARENSDTLKVLPERFGKEKYVFFYARGTSQEVVDFVDNIITEIRADGRLSEFYAKHEVKTDKTGESIKDGHE
ncbi:MAG: ABC transporter substrate-binding protein [Oscillospiraceae bacterium]|jgi:polar amino acid transport system substrate-binding protein|nr:ABC transporter substrate-binding protein [Oscillospiraceae bacterium]